jgi:hypothetical protein
VEAAYATGAEEPVAHELLREAEDNTGSNPRSALVLATAALEVGVKAYVAALIPDTRWLAFNAPSPPVALLLNRYLPTLKSRRPEPFPKPPTGLNKAVDDAV